jgi:Ca-activated chloride channel family protein
MKILLFSLLVPVSVWAQSDPSSVLSNRNGIEELKKSNPSGAQEKFLSGLSRNPFEARLHYNLALSFEALGQLDKAQASYETALKLAEHDPETRFSANFNLGLLAQKAKKKEEALHFYQEALNINPDSQETKTNIELLTQDQQGKGKGEGDQKDQKDQNGEGKGDSPKDDDKKDDKKDGQEPKDQKDQKKEYGKNKPQPRKFKSEELSQGDVNKILGEIKQQEQKIRAEFNRKEVKEKPRDKDW